MAIALHDGADIRKMTSRKHGWSPAPPRIPPCRRRRTFISCSPPRIAVDEDLTAHLLAGFENLAKTIVGLQSRVEVIEGRGHSEDALSAPTPTAPPISFISMCWRVEDWQYTKAIIVTSHFRCSLGFEKPPTNDKAIDTVNE